MQLTRHELAGHAEFTGDSAFVLRSLPEGIRPQIAQIDQIPGVQSAHICGNLRMAFPLVSTSFPGALAKRTCTA